MRQVRRWLTTAGVACVFGLCGWTCSNAMHHRHEIADEDEAVGHTVFFGLLGCLAALAGYVIECVQPARRKPDDHP